jgi:hypothetical protein
MKDTFRHFRVGRVLDAGYDTPLFLIGPDLAEKNRVRANIGFGLMLGNRISNKLRTDRAVDEYFFGFMS